MPTYLVVTSTPTSIKVEFNDLSSHSDINSLDATFKRSELMEIWHNNEPLEHLRLVMQGGRDWSLNLVGGNGMFPVTSVNGITPTNITELHNELNNLFI